MYNMTVPAVAVNERPSLAELERRYISEKHIMRAMRPVARQHAVECHERAVERRRAAHDDAGWRSAKAVLAADIKATGKKIGEMGLIVGQQIETEEAAGDDGRCSWTSSVDTNQQ